ncbi:MAG: class I SAM-dependent methyltransferase [Cytophagales bacterium]|nr:class I SAM-dependent methyltransferase [Cytophagales bacterium]
MQASKEVQILGKPSLWRVGYFLNKDTCMERLGQVFTPPSIVALMVSLIQNQGDILEPSAGDGAFLRELPLNRVKAIEINPMLCTQLKTTYPSAHIMESDFFDFTTSRRYDTIIGNPPYVRHQDILSTTKEHLNSKLFDRRSNLYLFFIERCIRLLREGGELIFITPRDILHLTSARKLRRFMHTIGTITYWQDLGDDKVFLNATPNCAVWRFEKGGSSGVLSLDPSGTCLGDYFDIKVGAVSGDDAIFTQEKYANAEFVCSRTRKEGYLRPMIYNVAHESLLPHKKRLLSRRIKRFDEQNWWSWGRACPLRKGKRIYVNTKTRHPAPFFVSDVPHFDGSVLALFPKKNMNLDQAAERLNSIDWKAKRFMCNNRYLFSQHSLHNCAITESL